MLFCIVYEKIRYWYLFFESHLAVKFFFRWGWEVIRKLETKYWFSNHEYYEITTKIHLQLRSMNVVIVNEKN